MYIEFRRLPPETYFREGAKECDMVAVKKLCVEKKLTSGDIRLILKTLGFKMLRITMHKFV